MRENSLDYQTRLHQKYFFKIVISQFVCFWKDLYFSTLVSLTVRLFFLNIFSKMQVINHRLLKKNFMKNFFHFFSRFLLR